MSLHGKNILTGLPTCVLQCCNLMLVEVIPKEPLSFSVFHYKNPKLQHTVQVQQHCIREQTSLSKSKSL